MKKFYITLLSLGIAACSISSGLKAMYDYDVELDLPGVDVEPSSQALVVFDPNQDKQQQMIQAFNLALKDPEIRKQLQAVVAKEKGLLSSNEERERTMMMAANLQLIEAMSRRLCPREEAFFEGVTRIICDTTKGVGKQVLGWGIIILVGTELARYAPRTLYGLVRGIYNHVECGRGIFGYLWGLDCVA